MTIMSPAEAFVETLLAEEVDHVFGILGTSFLPAMDLFDLAGIRFVSVVHEQTAAHMADGYARATGKHGVVAAQNGPGVTNLVTGIAVSYWAHSPVVAITPEAPTGVIGRGGYQELDQMPLFESITHYQVRVNRADRIAEHTHEAFAIAQQERGPVQINIPRDLFEGKIDISIPERHSVERSAGGPESLRSAAELLAGAKRPMIISGGGVVIADATAAVVKLAELLGAPVATVFRHGDAFPGAHSHCAGALGYLGNKAGMQMLSEADVVLALGCRFFPLGLAPQYDLNYWPGDAVVIQVNNDFRALQKVVDRKVDLPICGDAGLAAQAIIELIENIGLDTSIDERTARIELLQQRKKAWERELEVLSSTEGTPMMPRRAHWELMQAMPEDAMITLDTGAMCGLSQSYMRFNQNRSLFGPMNFAAIGCGMGTAMGAKLGQPDRPSVLYVGDGAWAMTQSELLTALRENIPVVVVVFNNRQYGAEKGYQLHLYNGRVPGANLDNPDFAEVARAMGADGVNIDNSGDIATALQSAIASNRPSVIEITVDEMLEPPLQAQLKGPKTYLAKYRR